MTYEKYKPLILREFYQASCGIKRDLTIFLTEIINRV